MAYTKQTWACGDEITAEKLNHIEDGIAEGGCDCGFECVETNQVLTDETVVISDGEGEQIIPRLSYTGFIDADDITVTFDGTEYTCQKNTIDGANAYGGYGASGSDFSVYPFGIISINGVGNLINTETTGTHTVKIEAVAISANVTACFKQAVQVAQVKSLLVKAVSIVTLDGDTGVATDTTYSELWNAMDNGIPCYFAFNPYVTVTSGTTLEDLQPGLFPIVTFPCIALGENNNTPMYVTAQHPTAPAQGVDEIFVPSSNQ